MIITYTDRNIDNLLQKVEKGTLIKEIYLLLKKRDTGVRLDYDERLILGLLTPDNLISKTKRNILDVINAKREYNRVWLILNKRNITLYSLLCGLENLNILEQEKQKKKIARLQEKEVARKKGELKEKRLKERYDFGEEGASCEVEVIYEVREKDGKVIDFYGVKRLEGNFYNGPEYESCKNYYNRILRVQKE